MNELVGLAIETLAEGELIREANVKLAQIRDRLLTNPLDKEPEELTIKIRVRNDPETFGLAKRMVDVETAISVRSKPHRFQKTKALFRGKDLVVSMDNSAVPMQPNLIEK